MTRITCAIRCASMLPGRAVPDPAACAARRRSPPARTRAPASAASRAAPPALGRRRTADHSARCSTSAIRASPLSVATAGRRRRVDDRVDRALGRPARRRWSAARRSRRARAARRRCSAGRTRSARPRARRAGELLAVGVEQVRDPVQPDRGLPGAGRALHADRLVERRRARCRPARAGWSRRCRASGRPRPLDLGLEDRACSTASASGPVRRAPRPRTRSARRGGSRTGAAAPRPSARSCWPGRTAAMTGARQSTTSGSPRSSVHVPPADVEPLAAKPSRRARRRVAVVEPAEEQRDGRVVLERLHPLPEGELEVLPADPVAAQRLHGGGAFAHPVKRFSRLLEVVLLARDLIVHWRDASKRAASESTGFRETLPHRQICGESLSTRPVTLQGCAAASSDRPMVASNGVLDSTLRDAMIT